MHAVLEYLPESTRVLHTLRLRRGYLKCPLPAPMLEDACFPVKPEARHTVPGNREALAVKLAVFPLSHSKFFVATGRTRLVPPVARS